MAAQSKSLLLSLAGVYETFMISFHTVVEFQLKSLPNEPNPYLWPLESTVIAITDKGKLTITNRYSPKT